METGKLIAIDGDGSRDGDRSGEGQLFDGARWIWLREKNCTRKNGCPNCNTRRQNDE